jgi:TetR/AcrR family transcriptional regulator
MAAAGEVFAQSGFAGARVDQIAADAGIHRATLFYYFKDKAEIHQALLTETLMDLQDRLAKPLASDNPAAMVDRAIETYVDFILERPFVARLLIREVIDRPPGEAREILRVSEPIITEVRKIIRDHSLTTDRPEIEPLHLIVMVSGAMNLLLAAAPSLGPSTRNLRPRQREALKKSILELVRAASGLHR